MVLGKPRHVKQWPNQSSYTSNHLIAKRDEYPCHAKQWPTPTSSFICTAPWAKNLVATNVMLDNCGTAILLAVRLVFCSAISKK